jgi:hypothetical protein
MEFQLGKSLQFGVNGNAVQTALCIVIVMHIGVTLFLCISLIFLPSLSSLFLVLCQEIKDNHKIYIEQTSSLTKVVL